MTRPFQADEGEAPGIGDDEKAEGPPARALETTGESPGREWLS